MNILITGAGGFLGKNLAAKISAAKLGRVMPFDISNTDGELESFIKQADFIFHLAGVNRPVDSSEFYTGNSGLTETLVRIIEDNGLAIPVAFSSTAQAGNGSDYAKSKESAEGILQDYSARTGAPVFIYRFPGIFGKWAKPNYNTVVATFCHNIASGLPIEIRDPGYELTLCYVDDIVDLLIATMDKRKALEIEPCYSVTLGGLAQAIEAFAKEREALSVPDLSDPFVKKLHATYLSYLPPDGFSYPLLMHGDDRGSFAEFLKMPPHGQVSINTSLPGVEKGNHWHNTKHEKFLVVYGKALIRLRKLGSEQVIEYYSGGNELRVIDIPPGYTHSLINAGDTEMVTVIWANEIFDPDNPDTFYETV